MRQTSAVTMPVLIILAGLLAGGCSQKIVHTTPADAEGVMPAGGTQAASPEIDPAGIEETDSQATPEEEPSFDAFDEFDEEMDEEAVAVADPIYYWNKAMYHFNDKMYFWLLKPAARGYGWAVPEPARIGIDNFFTNLGFPIRLAGCLLQAKGKEALGECGRFGVNTTIGILGFGNPARKYPSLNPPKEDVGQAFGKWGIGNGFYVVWPVFGPSTLRDSIGLAGEYFLDPVNYIRHSRYRIPVKAFDSVNHTSLHIGDYETLKESAIDPYVAIRDAYVQHRQKLVEE